MSNIRLSEDMIGNKVRCVYKADCDHPEVGTIGTIVDYDKHDTEVSYMVQWPKGTTTEDDRWWAINKCIELVENDTMNEQEIPDMTNEEIWEMLESKMVKNGLEPMGAWPKWENHVRKYFRIYSEDDVHNAIALAYKAGYIRSQKGRPFKIGKKKKKGGHWEPVDPNNLPKEGTRVRYSRECKTYENRKDEIVIGDTGVVNFEGVEHKWFGIKLDNCRRLYYNWLSFGGRSAGYLDMWVEDDE